MDSDFGILLAPAFSFSFKSMDVVQNDPRTRGSSTRSDWCPLFSSRHDYNDLQTLLRNLIIALAFPQTGPLLLTRYCLPRVPVFCATFLATRKEKESPRAILIETPNVSRTCFICSESSGDVLSSFFRAFWLKSIWRVSSECRFMMRNSLLLPPPPLHLPPTQSYLMWSWIMLS